MIGSNQNLDSLGATGVRYRHKEGDETGTVNVILVVFLPVAQILFVLIVIILIRVGYVRCCRKNKDPKLLQVVTSAQLHRQRLLLSEYVLQQQLDTFNIPPPTIREVLMTKSDSKKLTKQQLKQQEELLNCHLKPSVDIMKHHSLTNKY